MSEDEGKEKKKEKKVGGKERGELDYFPVWVSLENSAVGHVTLI